MQSLQNFRVLRRNNLLGEEAACLEHTLNSPAPHWPGAGTPVLAFFLAEPIFSGWEEEVPLIAHLSDAQQAQDFL